MAFKGLYKKLTAQRIIFCAAVASPESSCSLSACTALLFSSLLPPGTPADNNSLQQSEKHFAAFLPADPC